MKRSSKKILLSFVFSILLFALLFFAQPTTHHSSPTLSTVAGTDPQPLLAQAIRLKEALSFLGSSLSVVDEKRLLALRKPLVGR
ncbi:MAG: hypothetical protein WKI04_18445 [Ferruginibacter sp.]